VSSARITKKKQINTSGETRTIQSTPTSASKVSQEEKIFHQQVDEYLEERSPDFSKSVNIALVGKVSSGKSSLLNAILLRTRDNLVAPVGATSGVTKKIHSFKLDERVLIIDSPGLDDIVAANSAETDDFLKHIDLGILVVTGSVDATQKNHYDQLREKAKKALVVLNKTDEFKIRPEAFNQVVKQWQEALGADHVYPVRTIGFDPDAPDDLEMDVRGVDELRKEIWDFFKSEGKQLLLDRHLGDKRGAAVGIIVGALVLVAGEAVLPASTAWITATQAATITALYYLYTGKVLSKKAALASIPAFVAEQFGSNLYLWIKSLLPPTGVLDVIAIGVAVAVTAAMLATVNVMFSQGHELHETWILHEKYGGLSTRARKIFAGTRLADLSKADFVKQKVYQLMYE